MPTLNQLPLPSHTRGKEKEARPSATLGAKCGRGLRVVRLNFITFTAQWVATNTLRLGNNTLVITKCKIRICWRCFTGGACGFQHKVYDINSASTPLSSLSIPQIRSEHAASYHCHNIGGQKMTEGDK